VEGSLPTPFKGSIERSNLNRVGGWERRTLSKNRKKPPFYIFSCSVTLIWKGYAPPHFLGEIIPTTEEKLIEVSLL
jgi:hypothetical protein